MDLAEVETQRAALENYMGKLQKSLKHWQTWETEYQGLRDEIDVLPVDCKENDLLALATDLGCEVITEKELVELFGFDRGARRSNEQVVNILSRRIDYVQENVKSLKRHLSSAGAASTDEKNDQEPAEPRDEEGLPITEIFEELDDDDNVISSRVSNPADTADDVVSALRKAGLKDVEENEPSQQTDAKDTGQGSVPKDSHIADEMPPQGMDGSLKRETLNEVSPPGLEGTEDRPRQKSVSFAEGTKIESQEEKPSLVPLQRNITKSPVIADVKESFAGTGRIWEVDENDRPVDFSSPHIPIDESPEDAQMRREMLQYNMNEMGAIVAELELEEDGSDGSFTDDEDEDMSEMTEASDDEDEHGMSRIGHISDAYKDEMLDLEKKLNAQMVQNIGPRPDRDEIREQVVIPPQRTRPSNGVGGAHAASTQDEAETKSVRFAENLDIAPAPKQPYAGTRPKPSTPSTKLATAVESSIVERAAPKASPVVSAPTQPKISKFKAARAANSAAAQPQPMPGVPLAANIVERPPHQLSSNSNPPAEPDEFDPEQLQREVKADYYRMRNRLIKRQGGFKREDEEDDEEEAAYDEEDEHHGESDAQNGFNDMPRPQKKVSLFKAARIKPDRVW